MTAITLVSSSAAVGAAAVRFSWRMPAELQVEDSLRYYLWKILICILLEIFQLLKKHTIYFQL